MIRVLAKANKSAEILIHEAIGENWYGDGLTSKRFAQQLKDLGDVENIKVRINSPGGAVSDGVAIYNTLKAHGATIEVVVEGMAASIASIIAMAGSSIEMGEGALMMVHSPWTWGMGNADQMRELAAVLDKFEDALLDIYVSRTGQARDEVRKLLKAETWLNGEDAVRLGFADKRTNSGDDEASALLQTQLKATFEKFATKFRQSADVTPQRIAAALFPSATAESQESPMNEEERRAAEAAQQKAINAAVQAALRANRERQNEIRDLFGPRAATYPDLLAECLADTECNWGDASKKLLAAMAKDQPGPLGGAPLPAADARDKFLVGAEKAINH